MCAALIFCYITSFQSYSDYREIAFAISLVVLLISYLHLVRTMVLPWRRILITMAEGKSVVLQNIPTNEIREIGIRNNQLLESMENANDFIKTIAEGDFSHTYKESQDTLYQDVLKDNLIHMREQVMKYSEGAEQRSWVSEGLAKFGDILRKNDGDYQQLSEAVLSNLIKYMDANQGALFVMNDDSETSEKNSYLDLVACYAYERKKYINRKVEVGFGLVGQVVLERESMYLTDIPSSYIKITSGLGHALPKSLLLVPLKIDDIVYGVIELASFEELPKYKIEFVEELGESIAARLSTLKVNMKTQALLEESKQQTEELRAQEEEMRQNHEEMEATQEELQRKQKELLQSQEKSNTVFENSLDVILVCDSNGSIDNINSAGHELFQLEKDKLDGLALQQLLKKFSPEAPKSFLNRKRRSKITNMKGEVINVETYILQKNIEGKDCYLAYIRDIRKEVEKERQIAESLMNVDELKSQLKTSGTS